MGSNTHSHTERERDIRYAFDADSELNGKQMRVGTEERKGKIGDREENDKIMGRNPNKVMAECDHERIRYTRTLAHMLTTLAYARTHEREQKATLAIVYFLYIKQYRRSIGGDHSNDLNNNVCTVTRLSIHNESCV